MERTAQQLHNRHRVPSLLCLLLLAGAALAYLGTARLLATLTKSGGPPQLILPEPSRANFTRADATRAAARNASSGAELPTAALSTAVLVETRCHPAFSLVLHSAVRNLGPDVPIVVGHSPHNAIFVRGVIAAILELVDARQRIALQETRESEWGQPCPARRGNGCGIYSKDFWYSRMFTSLKFWEAFTTPYVLTL